MTNPFWGVLPTILWIAFLSAMLWAFRAEVRGLVRAILSRLRHGAMVKVGTLEIGAVIAVPGRVEKTENTPTVREDKERRRDSEREQYYEDKRRVMLVHKLLPSTEPGELYDILIYLIPSYRGTLLGVQQVEYYFGAHGWKNRIFRASDRSHGFAVLTAAYGPFLCTAEVLFTDGKSVMLHRFIDFKMGETVGGPAELANDALKETSRSVRRASRRQETQR